MPSLESLATSADNTPIINNQLVQAAKALANDENYAQLDTISIGLSAGVAGTTATFSDWDDIASGLPNNATIRGVQVRFPEYYGNISQMSIRISVNGGTDLSLGKVVNLSNMQKTSDEDESTPRDDEADLWGLTWDHTDVSWSWDDVHVVLEISGGTTNRQFYYDYITLIVHYTLPDAQTTYTSDDQVTLSGGTVELKNGMTIIG